MIKKSFLLFLILMLTAVFVSADYLVLKNGKKIKIDGKYKIENESVIFKIPGNDLELTLPLEKIDIEKTKAANTEKASKTDEKKVKVITKKDIKEEDKVISTTEDDGTNENPVNTEAPAVQSVPTYYTDELNARENDWWTDEIGRVQQMLQEAYKLNRKAINEYNDLVMDFNSRRDADKATMKPRMDAKSEEIKQSKQLVKSWYNAIKQLYDSGVELGKEAWILKPLADTLEANKDAVE